jgi:hypothetical protein
MLDLLKDVNGADYNIVCQGFLTIDRETSTARITADVMAEV